MRQILVPGKPVEIPTLEEVNKTVIDALRAKQNDDRLLRTSGNFATTAAGAGVLDNLYTVPPGFELELLRWAVPNVDGFSPGVLFNAAGGWIELIADEMRVAWFRLAAGGSPGGGIPAEQSWGARQGPVISNGQRLGILISGGPASTNMEVRIQGVLRRLEQSMLSR